MMLYSLTINGKTYTPVIVTAISGIAIFSDEDTIEMWEGLPMIDKKTEKEKRDAIIANLMENYNILKQHHDLQKELAKETNEEIIKAKFFKNFQIISQYNAFMAKLKKNSGF